MKKLYLFIIVILVLFLGVLPIASLYASSVDVAVVDVTAPTGSVTLAPSGSGSITINMTVTGKQEGTATFTVNRDWTLSGGIFTGSNPQTFTVNPRAAQDAATTFSTTGTVNVASGQAAGTFTLAVSTFNITNSNATGAKLNDGSDSNYQVTVSIPAGDTTPPVITTPSPITVEGNTTGGYLKSSLTAPSVTDNVDPNPSITNDAPDPLPLGLTTVTWTAKDASNNSSSVTQNVTVVDTTPPIITAVSTFSTIVGAPKSVLPTPTVSDIVDPNPIVTNNAPNNFPLGTTIVTWTATDHSGNFATATTTVTTTYNYIGVLQPINDDGAGPKSIFKLGSTIPVKFQLMDYYGNFVTNAKVCIVVAQYSGLPPADGDYEGAISTSAATIGNLFRYDPLANQYIFNLSTKSLSKGEYKIRLNVYNGDTFSYTLDEVIIGLK